MIAVSKSGSYTIQLKNLFLKHRIFIVLATITVFAKVLMASLGTNPDLESWQIVGDITSQGKTIYDNTARYNYGPAWAYVCGVVALIVKSFGAPNVYTPTFHLLIAGILSLVDVGIAILLIRMFNKTAGMLFLLNPISLVLTGSHSQFDNVAIFFGLLAWHEYMLNQKNRAYVFFGISMLFKHLLLFFPLWLVLVELLSSKSRKEKLHELFKIASIYGIFLAGFAFEVLRGFDHKEQILAGILKNVIMYRGYGASLGTVITDLVVPKNFFELSLHFPIFKGYMFYYMLFSVIAGLMFIKRKIDTKYFYPFYLAVFFALSFTVARQYFVIPLVAVFIFYNRIESIIYTLAGFTFISTNAFSNVAQYIKVSTYLNVLGTRIKLLPWTHEISVTYNNAQVWILILCVGILVTATAQTAKKYDLYAKKAMIAVFVVCYVSLGLYTTSQFTNQESNTPRLLNKTPSNVVFTCAKENSKVYTSYSVENVELTPSESISNILTCPSKIPLF